MNPKKYVASIALLSVVPIERPELWHKSPALEQSVNLPPEQPHTESEYTQVDRRPLQSSEGHASGTHYVREVNATMNSPTGMVANLPVEPSSDDYHTDPDVRAVPR